MGIDSSVASSRRALLAGAVGGMAALAADAVAGPLAANAASGDVMVVGAANIAFTPTVLDDTSSGDTAFQVTSSGGISILGNNNGAGVGVDGASLSSVGVRGTSTGHQGVQGQSTSSIGVEGISSSGFGVRGSSATSAAVRGDGSSGSGVEGMSQTGNGVVGSSASAIGVAGTTAAVGGVAVQARDLSAGKAVALQAIGRLRFSTSGVANIAAGTTTRVVTPGVDVLTSSFVLLTPAADIGARRLWFTVNATANTFTVHLTPAPTVATRIAWLLVG